MLFIYTMEDTENTDEKLNTEKTKSKVYIVPTSHASEKSSERVRETVEAVKPDAIAVELDKQRLEKLKKTRGKIEDKSAREVWSNTKGAGIKARVMLVVFSVAQSKIASKLGMDLIGKDMLTGYDLSQEKEIPLALVDRDIDETFQRFSEEVSNFQMIKILFYFTLVYFKLKFTSDEELSQSVKIESESEDGEESIDINEMMESLEKTLPEAKKVIIDERDRFISSGTIEVANNLGNTVLVIGAAHEPGVRKILSDSEDVDLVSSDDLERLKEQSVTYTEDDEVEGVERSEEYN